MKGSRLSLPLDRLPWKETALLVVLPAVVFFLSQTRPILTGDSKPAVLTAVSLARSGHTELSAFAALYGANNHYNRPGELPYFFAPTASGVYSAYPSGMVVFTVPAAALARLLGADLDRTKTLDHLEKGVASCLAAACLGLFFLLALHLADARSAWLMTLLLATGSALCSTVGQAVWQHGGVVFWMLLALLIEFRAWQRPTFRSVLLQAVALGMMFACRPASAVLIAPLGLWVAWRSPRRAVLLALLGGLAYVPWACYYQAIYDTPLGPSAGQVIGFAGFSARSLLPLLAGPDHGLLVYQPWILLGLAAFLPVGPASRRSEEQTGETPVPPAVPPGWRGFCLAAIVLQLGLISTWGCWWGGHCWGSRLLTEIVPLFGLLCLCPVAVLRRAAWGRRLILATALAGCLVHLTGVYLKADYRDVQPGLFTRRAQMPGSWQLAPFLTPFLGKDRSMIR